MERAPNITYQFTCDVHTYCMSTRSLLCSFKNRITFYDNWLEEQIFFLFWYSGLSKNVKLVQAPPFTVQPCVLHYVDNSTMYLKQAHTPEYWWYISAVSVVEVVLVVWGERTGACTSLPGCTSPPTPEGGEGTGASSPDHLLLLRSAMLLIAGEVTLSWWEASECALSKNSARDV